VDVTFSSSLHQRNKKKWKRIKDYTGTPKTNLLEVSVQDWERILMWIFQLLESFGYFFSFLDWERILMAVAVNQL
jgi:hypothetical protein